MRERLEALAALHGVETGYHDIEGRWHAAEDGHLLHVLQLLGAPLSGPEEAEEALRFEAWVQLNRVLEPVQVVWEGGTSKAFLQVLSSAATGPFRLRIEGEQDVHIVEGQLQDARVADHSDHEGRTWLRLEVDLPRLALGYHRLTLSLGRLEALGTLIVAPATTHAPEGERCWGVFAPTYALRAEGDRGVGDFGHLRRLAQQVADAGGHLVATLPLLSTFLDHPVEPSPYVPASRLFWNELFLDLERLPEAQAPELARMLEDPAFRREAARLRERSHVDHARAYQLIEPILSAFARAAWDSSTAAAIETWAEGRTRAWDYARFRAATLERRQVWHQWPLHERRGSTLKVDDEARVRQHLYVQFRLDEQLRQLGEPLASVGGGLYLDLPLGVHPDGYDAWADQHVFVHGISSGAPPDALAPEGQDWGFRPFHPRRLRESGYAYLIEVMRRQAEIASTLRIDHVMGLHRIFGVPWSLGAKGGTYLRYREDELWAIVCVESQRHRCRVVGEDLGTVPPAVRERMARHRAQRMYVAQFEMEPNPNAALRPIPEHAAASVNTHDTPTFMGFWSHGDIEERVERGVATAEEASHEHSLRNQRVDALRTALGEGRPLEAPLDVWVELAMRLARSSAPLLLLNLEDLWLEPEPQNVPGTRDERPNWSRRLRLGLENIEQSPELRDLLRALSEARSGSSL
ncbi:MAG: 4-alpha-glucanotransferase [Myxococcota bacterium]